MKRIVALLLAGSMLLSLAACGGGNKSSGEAKNAGETAEVVAGTTEESASGKKDSLVVANAAEAQYFFPPSEDSASTMDDCPVIHNIYEGLIKSMPDGSFEPLLATEWEISGDGLKYTFHLRDDVHFHNGEEMTAEDVQFSLDLSGNTSNGQSILVNYDHTEIVDEDTVVVHVTAPYAPFLNGIASRVAFVYDKSYYEQVGEAGYMKEPVGTGAYKFTEHVSGSHTSMEYFEDYWGEEPVYKAVTVKVMSDTNTQMLALENGEVDVLLNAPVAQVLQLPEDGAVKYATADSSSIQNIVFNTRQGVCQNLDFRKALMYGINREEIVIGAYEGIAELTDIYMVPSFTAYPEVGSYTAVEHDTEKAKQYLEASGYNGEEFSIITITGTKNELVAQIIQGQLIELGINCTVNAVDSSSYWNSVLFGDGSDWDAHCRAGSVSVVDGDGLYLILNSDRYASTGMYMEWPEEISDQLRELTERGRVTVDEEERKAIYAEVCDLVNANATMLNICGEPNMVAFNESVEGVEPRALNGVYYYQEWY